MNRREEGALISEDTYSPVEIQPGVDVSTPEDWEWRRISTSQPNSATFHISHSGVTRVMVDRLGPSDSPDGSQFSLKAEIPIIVIDSLDKYWAGESTTRLPLQGLRVPVEGDTLEEAKKNLAGDLAAQMRLLLLLSTSHEGDIAPQLQANLQYLLTVFTTPGS